MALSQAVAPRCRFLGVLAGHTRRITSPLLSAPTADVSPRRRWDDTVKIWDVETRRELLSLCGHTEKVTCVAFSPDGRFVASSSQDRTVRLWDSATGREVLTLRDPTDRVFGVAYHPDGTRIGAACVDGRLLVFDARTGALLHDFRTDTGQELYFVAFSPDGTRIAAAGEPGIVMAWDLATGNAIPNHRPVDARFCSGIGFDAFGRCLGFLSNDRSAVGLSVDGRTGRSIVTLEGHTGSVTGVALSPDGTRLASSSSDMVVRIWNARTGEKSSWLSMVIHNRCEASP